MMCTVLGELSSEHSENIGDWQVSSHIKGGGAEIVLNQQLGDRKYHEWVAVAPASEPLCQQSVYIKLVFSLRLRQR